VILKYRNAGSEKYNNLKVKERKQNEIGKVKKCKIYKINKKYNEN